MAYSSPQLPIYLAAHLGGMRDIPAEAFATDDRDGAGLHWGDYAYRRARYSVNWAHYDGSIYRCHPWSEKYKDSGDLFEFTRAIYSPAPRIGNFWPGHLLGGMLDPEAGDGRQRPSAVPIAIPDENPKADALRAAIATLWGWSVWQPNKDTWTRQGTVLGDAFLVGVDDPARQKVYMEVIHPATVERCDVDAWGNVKGYVIRRKRADPRPRTEGQSWGVRDVWYLELATKTGESVHFQTFLQDEHANEPEPYDWRDYPDDRTPRVGPEWTEDYGFIPMVKVQHLDMGLGWGWAEYHATLGKFLEVDDQASRLGDQNRKQLEVIWYYAGAKEGQVVMTAPENSRDDPQKSRRVKPTLYGPAGSQPYPMVGKLNIAGCLENIRGIIGTIEKEHPELLADDVGPGDSGAARRIAREKVEALVVGRRAAYDDALVRMHQMLISIGASKGYPGFEAFTAESFGRGELEHSIGIRPVFAVSSSERTAEALMRGQAVAAFVGAGCSRVFAMKQVGYSDEEVEADAAEARAEQQRAMTMQAETLRMQAEAKYAVEIGSSGDDEVLAMGADR